MCVCFEWTLYLCSFLYLFARLLGIHLTDRLQTFGPSASDMQITTTLMTKLNQGHAAQFASLNIAIH